MIRWAWCEADTGEMRIAYGIFVGKCEGRGRLRRPVYKWAHNIK